VQRVDRSLGDGEARLGVLAAAALVGQAGLEVGGRLAQPAADRRDLGGQVAQPGLELGALGAVRARLGQLRLGGGTVATLVLQPGLQVAHGPLPGRERGPVLGRLGECGLRRAARALERLAQVVELGVAPAQRRLQVPAAPVERLDLGAGRRAPALARVDLGAHARELLADGGDRLLHATLGRRAPRQLLLEPRHLGGERVLAPGPRPARDRLALGRRKLRPELGDAGGALLGGRQTRPQAVGLGRTLLGLGEAAAQVDDLAAIGLGDEQARAQLLEVGPVALGAPLGLEQPATPGRGLSARRSASASRVRSASTSPLPASASASARAAPRARRPKTPPRPAGRAARRSRRRGARPRPAGGGRGAAPARSPR
jgi:hypothetical protein